MFKIKKIFKTFYIRYKSYSISKMYNNKYEFISILDKRYKVLRGTFQSRPDYDDAWLSYLSQKANVVFDIGCHTGKSALLISCSKSIKKLILVDPNPLSLSMAAENLIINNLSQDAIFLPKAAYSRSDETIRLWTMKGAFSGASINKDFTQTGSITDSYFTVETVTLDDIANTYNSFPDLVKIDVEGAEHSVLEGAINIANGGNTIFIVEVHSCEKMNIMEITDQILYWCKQNNYKGYYMSEHIEITNSKVVTGRGRYHLLLIHQDAKYPVGLNGIKQAESIYN